MATGDRYRDREGDVWAEQPDGEFRITESENSFNIGSEGSREWVAREYGPLVSLNPSPTDLSAPATRGDIVRVLEAVRSLARSGPLGTVYEIDAMISVVEEGRA